MQRATTFRALVGTLVITIATGTSFAQELRQVTVVRAELEAAATDQRVGLELKNGSRLFGTIGTLKKDRFDLNDRPGHSFKIHYDEFVAFLDPNTGSVTGIVVKPVVASVAPDKPHLDLGAKILISALVGIGLFVLGLWGAQHGHA